MKFFVVVASALAALQASANIELENAIARVSSAFPSQVLVGRDLRTGSECVYEMEVGQDYEFIAVSLRDGLEDYSHQLRALITDSPRTQLSSLRVESHLVEMSAVQRSSMQLLSDTYSRIQFRFEDGRRVITVETGNSGLFGIRYSKRSRSCSF